MQWLTYWVVYAFLTVFESAVNAVYWFREADASSLVSMDANQDRSILLHLQVRPCRLDGPSSDEVRHTSWSASTLSYDLIETQRCSNGLPVSDPTGLLPLLRGTGLHLRKASLPGRPGHEAALNLDSQLQRLRVGNLRSTASPRQNITLLGQAPGLVRSSKR